MRQSLTAIVFVIASAATAAAQTDSATFNASLTGIARLSLSAASITFPDADPDTVAEIAAIPGFISLTAKARATAGSAVSLTVLAADNLRSGIDTISASAITWTAGGSGFVPGTLNAITPQPVGAWSGSGVRTGTISFFFRNSWAYPTGTYTLTMLFTLSAP